jgi:nucleoside-diphosphate-sugar epimerase
MNILVTGGAGFTGRRIVELLHTHGHHVVSYNRDLTDNPMSGVVAVQGELFDIPRLLTVIDDHSVDAIVHTAAMSHPTLSLDFPVATFAANSEGTVAILEAARLKAIRRVVNFSSETVYGSVEGPVSEDTATAPTTPYAVTKVAGELLGKVYAERYGVDVISLRIAQVYGPGNRMPEIVGDILKSVVSGKPFTQPYGRDHCYNLVYVNDVAEAALAAISAPYSETRQLAYNISSQEYWSLHNVINEIETLCPGADIHVGPGRDTELDLQGQFETTAAADALAFTSMWPLNRALPDYLAWLGAQHF